VDYLEAGANIIISASYQVSTSNSELLNTCVLSVSRVLTITFGIAGYHSRV
jgi:S-methylmethionine-dependent homocysteine/selenocysteine methylase